MQLAFNTTVLSSTSKLLWLCGAVVLAGVAIATLGPAEWVLRTGLHWLVEHFLVYFAVTATLCVAWPRPFLLAALLILLAGLLEALQGVTLDRTPDLLSALSGAGGVLTAALLASLIMRAQTRSSNNEPRSDLREARKFIREIE